MTGEMTDRSNQDLAFSLLQMTYRLGQILGQLSPCIAQAPLLNANLFGLL